MRDLFANEEVFHWSDVCDHEDVPHCYTLAMVIDPKAMGLDEIRVNDISTTFTRPKNYMPHIAGGAVFVREKWNTPMGEVYQVPLNDLGTQLERVQQATLEAVLEAARACPGENSSPTACTCYYIDMILPHLRLAGTLREGLRADSTSGRSTSASRSYYYDITKRGFAQATVPQKIFSGEGYLPFGEKADKRRSKYFWS